MDSHVIERRKHKRIPADQAAWRALRLRTGDPLALVNVGKGGVLVESARRLLPGTSVVLLASVDGTMLTLRAHVTRSAVHALARDGVQYRSALRFEEPDEMRCSGA